MKLGWPADNYYRGIEVVTLSDVYILNTNPNEPGMNKTWFFRNSIEKEKSHSVQIGRDIAYGFKFTIGGEGKIGIPFVAEGKASASMENSFTYTAKNLDDWKKVEKTVLMWDESGQVFPGRAIHCKAEAISGKHVKHQLLHH